MKTAKIRRHPRKKHPHSICLATLPRKLCREKKKKRSHRRRKKQKHLLYFPQWKCQKSLLLFFVPSVYSRKQHCLSQISLSFSFSLSLSLFLSLQHVLFLFLLSLRGECIKLLNGTKAEKMTTRPFFSLFFLVLVRHFFLLRPLFFISLSFKRDRASHYICV